jgi:addiction module HigA family antidote
MHPGELLREDILPALDMTRTAFADAIGVTRNTLQRILSGRSAVSPEMAVRLGKALGNGPAFWLRLQSAFDLHRAQAAVDVSAIQTLEAA